MNTPLFDKQKKKESFFIHNLLMYVNGIFTRDVSLANKKTATGTRLIDFRGILGKLVEVP